MRILIAEDETTIARALKVLLEKNKYAVDMVCNGRDALDYIQATQYDALILDIMMPGMDGMELLRCVRAAGITTPALFLTAKAEITNLVTLLRLNEENPLPVRTTFFLSDALWEIGETFVSVAKGKGERYVQQIEDGLTLTGDRTAIGKRVSILLDNVLKYSLEDG